MSARGIIILAAVFLVAFSLLGLGQCGYRKIESLQSIENAEADIRSRYPSVESISADTFSLYAKADQSLLVVDARTPEEYEVSHLPESVNLASVIEVQNYLKQLEPTPEHVVVYGSLGFRSAKLANQLQRAGIKRVKHLEGSIFRWANEGGSIIQGDGVSAALVHPHNRHWGRLLESERRSVALEDL